MTTTDPTRRTPTELAEAYFTAWAAGDEETLRSLFSPDATFRGPLGSADGRDACVAGLMGMSEMIDESDGLDVQVRVADDTDVITFFELRVPGAPATPTANWSHAEGGYLTAVRVAFDPRGILGAG